MSLPHLRRLSAGPRLLRALVIGVTVALVALVTTAGSAAGPGGALRTSRDVAYAGPDSDRLQRLDIHAPEHCPEAGCPVLAFVHGGAWERGDKRRIRGMGATYASFGIIFVSVNYRLSPAVVHPAHVQDVAAAVAWLKQRSRDYGGDPARIFLMGHSAGAHLVALVTVDPQYLAAHGLKPRDVAGVVPVDTATYDLTFFSSRIRTGDEKGRAGTAAASADEEADAQRDDRPSARLSAFGDDPTTLRAASPMFVARPGVGYPPFLIPYVAHRLKTAVRESERFAEVLRNAGATVRTLSVPNKNHGTIKDGQENPDDPVTQAVVAFIRSGTP